MVTLTSSGSSRSSTGSFSRSARDNMRGLAVACFIKPIATALLPLKRTMLRSFSAPIPTRATSLI